MNLVCRADLTYCCMRHATHSYGKMIMRSQRRLQLIKIQFVNCTVGLADKVKKKSFFFGM